nr:hypothetical protein pmam_136 [Pithovirus mammoth]
MEGNLICKLNFQPNFQTIRIILKNFFSNYKSNMSIRCQGMGKFGPCTRSTKSGFCHDHIYIHNIHSHEERIEQMQQKALSLGKLSQNLSEKLLQEAEMAKADPERYQLSEELFQDFDEISNICSILQMLFVVKTKQSVLKGIHFLPVSEPQQELSIQTPVNIAGKCCHIHTRNGMAGQPCGRKVKHGNYCTQHAYHNNQKPRINSVVQSNRYFENTQNDYLPQAVMSQIPVSRQQNFGWNNSFLAPTPELKTPVPLPIRDSERTNLQPHEKKVEIVQKNQPNSLTSSVAETTEEAPKTKSVSFKI